MYLNSEVLFPYFCNRDFLNAYSEGLKKKKNTCNLHSNLTTRHQGCGCKQDTTVPSRRAKRMIAQMNRA